MKMLNISSIQNQFKNLNRLDLESQYEQYACVGIIILQSKDTLPEVGFIKRAIHPSDRWSGQIAFPGGKKDPEDASDLRACLREIKEEIGYELKSGQVLGLLDDIRARKAQSQLDFFIRPFVFHIEKKQIEIIDKSEIDHFFWVPWSHLTDPSHQTKFTLRHEERIVNLPAITLPNQEVLWGLSYQMLSQLKALIEDE